MDRLGPDEGFEGEMLLLLYEGGKDCTGLTSWGPEEERKWRG